MTPRTARRHARWRAVLGWLLLGAAAAAWFLSLGPAQLGGPATYAVIGGHSMEPLLRTDDLVVARERAAYAVGDLVVFQVRSASTTGLVAHRLVGGDAATGWTTKGDNRAAPDDWTLPDAAIRGVVDITVPRAGGVMTWATGHPWQLATILAVLAAASCLPWRRRRLAAPLAAALATAQREPRRSAPRVERILLATTAVPAFLCLAALAAAYAGKAAPVLWLLPAAGLIVSGGLALVLAARVSDGAGAPEPERSLRALSGRLHLVEELPLLDAEPTPARSAVALRTVAEKYRLPLLHRVDAATGVHEFLLITVQEGAHVWRAAPGTAPDAASPEPEPALGPAGAAPPTAAALLDGRADRRRAVRRGRWRSRRRTTGVHEQHPAR